MPAFPPPPRKFTSRGLGERGGCHHAAGFIWRNLAERDRALNPWVATSELKAAVHAAYVESRFALHLDAMPCLAIPLGLRAVRPRKSKSNSRMMMTATKMPSVTKKKNL